MQVYIYFFKNEIVQVLESLTSAATERLPKLFCPFLCSCTTFN